ncbi:MAG TPA: hypothetical protein VJA21_30015 [Verrucomicrobiae bacterium]
MQNRLYADPFNGQPWKTATRARAILRRCRVRLCCEPAIFRHETARDLTPKSIARDVQEKFAAGIDVVGPECAVPLDAHWMNLRALAEEAKRQSIANSRAYR